MTLSQLGKTLAQMYNSAPHGEMTTMIHLFGIKYADEIINSGYTSKDIVIEAELKISYATEVQKGIKLSQYVNPIS